MRQFKRFGSMPGREMRHTFFMLTIEAARGRARRDFIALTDRLYACEPDYAPLFASDVAHLLREGKGLICYRDGQPAARALVVQRTVSLFEAADVRAGTAVLRAAVACGAQKAAPIRTGGLGRAAWGLPHNPGWYAACMAQARMAVQERFLSLEWKKTDALADYVQRCARAQERRGYVIRALDAEHYEAEARALLRMMAICGEQLDTCEVAAQVRALRPLIDPALVRIAVCRGEPVAFVFALPDYNQALAYMRGEGGFVRFSRAVRKIDSFCVLMQYCLPNWRDTGAACCCLAEVARAALEKGYTHAQTGLIRADNKKSLQTAREAGCREAFAYASYALQAEGPEEAVAPGVRAAAASASSEPNE